MQETKYSKHVRELLEEQAARYGSSSMTPRQRVQAAIRRQPSDRVPFDFWAVDEVIAALRVHLGVETVEEILRLFSIDCRVLRPDYIGPAPERFEDGSFFIPWGSHRRLVSNAFSTYEEYASFPLASAQSAAEVRTWTRWPKTEYWDWQGFSKRIDAINAETPYHVRYEVGGIFESAWALYGLDRFLIDLYDRPEIPCAVMDCYTDLMIVNVHSLMKACAGKIDMVYTYDDVATQNGLMMSPAMWRQFILPRHVRLNQVIKSYDLPIMYHSCGAIAPLVGELISQMHIDVLNPLQPRAKGMDMPKIKQDFGSQIAFHGGIDLQQTMAHGSPKDVQSEVRNRLQALAPGGGYICTTAHYMQADTPLENIIALYTAPRDMPEPE